MQYNSVSITYRRSAIVLAGSLLAVLAGFYFFNVPVRTESVDSPPDLAPQVNGKLAFSRGQVPSPEYSVFVTNADGSGASGGTSGSIGPNDPSWAPDGVQIVVKGINTGELYVINGPGGGQVNITNSSGVEEQRPSWGATGKIAYERSGQIWTINPDGTGAAQFPGITQPFPGYPAWSPDGSKLAFMSNNDIWVIDANGTNERRVAQTAAGEADPAWSPDGTKIIYTKGGNSVAVMNLDGTNEIILASGREPSWSPDGTKIAYTSGGIMIMDANGANQIRIRSNTSAFPLCCDNFYEDPAWQPVPQTPSTSHITGRVTYNNLAVPGVIVNLSGTTNASVTTDLVGNYQFSVPTGGNYVVSPSFPRFYFTPPNRTFTNLTSNQLGANFTVLGICLSGRCVRSGKIAFNRGGDIFTIFTDGTGQTNITNNAATDGEPEWSPDGVKILFSSSRDGNLEIYRLNAEDDPNPTRLTNDAGSDTSPRYSPDGSTIVFVSTRDGNNEIYKMNADGSNQVRLTNDPLPQSAPAFSPDGNKIVFVHGNTAQTIRLYTMNADGSNPQPLPHLGGPSPAYERPSYSPDGSKIIFTYSPDLSTSIRVTWTMNADGTGPAVFPAGGSYGTYSPDGTGVAYTCCLFDNTNRLRTSDAAGSAGSVRTLTPSNTGNGLPDWQGFQVPRAQFDFDADGRSDVAVFRPSEGAWYIQRSTAGFAYQSWGVASDVLTPADYDGDLKTDIAVWRPSEGNFYILNSFTSTLRQENFGLAGDIPTGGDFDADGKADVAVYRGGAESTFYYRGSMGNPTGSTTFIPWGLPGDKPVVGDYDGDGRSDAAVYRPSNGTWFIRQSSNGQLFAMNFGLANDNLVPADYDADGKTDIAVFREGVWYIMQSAAGFTAFQFGMAKDIPVPADYDGDGRADAAVYRNGVWWILKSQTGGFDVVQFGLGSDKPIEAAFVR